MLLRFKNTFKINCVLILKLLPESISGFAIIKMRSAHIQKNMFCSHSTYLQAFRPNLSV